MVSAALDAGQVKNLTLGGLAVIVLLGLLLCLLISALVGRLVVILLVLVLGALLWTQRSTVQSRIRNCDANVSFLGYHVSFTAAQVEACTQLSQ